MRVGITSVISGHRVLGESCERGPEEGILRHGSPRYGKPHDRRVFDLHLFPQVYFIICMAMERRIGCLGVFENLRNNL